MVLLTPVVQGDPSFPMDGNMVTAATREEVPWLHTPQAHYGTYLSWLILCQLNTARIIFGR